MVSKIRATYIDGVRTCELHEDEDKHSKQHASPVQRLTQHLLELTSDATSPN